MQFYTAPRIFRLTGKDGGYKFFKFHVQNILDAEGNEIIDDKTGKPKKKALVRNYIQNLDTGKISEELDATEYEINGQFSVKVSTGSSLPFAKNETAEKSIKLFQLGIIDDQEVLKSLDYPNWEAVLQRVKQRKQEQMQEAAAMAQAQQAGKAAGGAPPNRQARPPGQ